MDQKPKSKLVVLLLSIFVGTLGIHNFYMGYTKRAVIQLLVSILGGSFTFGLASIGILIWAIYEGVQVFNGTVTEDAFGIPFVD